MASLIETSLTAAGQTVTVDKLYNFGSLFVATTGTWSGTLSFSASIDGISFTPVRFLNTNTLLLSSTATVNSLYIANPSGFEAVRITATALTSGTVDLKVRGQHAPYSTPGPQSIEGASDRTLIGNDGDGLKTTIKGAGTTDLVNTRLRQDGLTGLATEANIGGLDALGTYRQVNTKVRSDGLRALATDATVVVESTFGFDQQPDSFFRIINTGASGDQWTIYIAGTSADPTAPDRDVPAFSKTFTVLPAEVGDELALRDRIIQELNADNTFRQVCFFKAQNATDRGIVHIYSEKFSASGEFYERPGAGDFNVTVTGSAVVFVGFDNLISRSKPVTITRDLDSPHRLGLFGITGSVNVTAKELSDIFFAEALNNGSSNMAVNGSLANPVEFRIDAQAETEIFINTLIFSAQGNGIQFGNFLSRNQPLTNGLLVEIKSDNIITAFPVIRKTEDFKNRFAALSGSAANFSLDIQSGADEMVAILQFENPFIVRSAGTFTIDDYISVKVRDNISNNPTRLDFAARGFEKEP